MKKFLLSLTAALLGMMGSLQAQNVTIDRSGWNITAYSNATTQIENAADGRAFAAIDGNSATWYHSDWSGSKTGAGMPQAFLIDMAEEHELTGFNYQGRTDKTDGTKPTEWRIYLYTAEEDMPFGGFDKLQNLANKNSALSTDGLGTADASGTWIWTGNDQVQTFHFDTPKNARYILFVADATVQTDNYWLTCAEFNALEKAPSCLVNSTDGVFEQLPGTTSTWAYKWTSNSKEPEITLSVDRNNMKETADGLQCYTGLNNYENVYTLSISEGFRILGYNIIVRNDDPAYSMLVTAEEINTVLQMQGSTEYEVPVSGMCKKSTTFGISCETQNKGVLVKKLEVFYGPYDEESLERTKLFDTANSDIPYRIPAIAATCETGRLIAVNGYLVCGTDIGYGQVDLHYRYSDDNGQTWSKTLVMAEGNGNSGDPKCGYGDPAIVADCEDNNEVLVISVTGNTIYSQATRNNPNRIARHRSHDGGLTWEEPEEITESIYSLYDSGNVVQSMFVGSGKICQSKTVKVGSHYRIYAALCAKPNGNRVIYSDDFGETWNALGGAKALPVPNGDEPKCEELPDGRLLISSRCASGRYYNIYTFTNSATAEGEWASQTFSGAVNNGIAIGGNSTNGEILIVPAVRNADEAEVYVALQSVPMAGSRNNVGIFYKELFSAEDWKDVTAFAKDWDGSLQVSQNTSAYSTMCLQKDDKIGFFFEENYRYIGVKDGHNNDGYDGIYIPISLEKITDKAYSIKRDIDRTAILKRFFEELLQGADVSDAIKGKLQQAIENLSTEGTYEETDLIRNLLAGNDPEQTDFTEEMKAAIAEARLLLGMTGVGYPANHAEQRTTLKEKADEAEAKIGTCTFSRDDVAAFEGVIEQYVATDDIEMPVAGKAYTITCVSKSGVRAYMCYDEAADRYDINVTTDTDNTNYPESARLTARDGETAGKYNFVDNGGRFLVYRGANSGGSSNGYNSNRGYANSHVSAAELSVLKMQGDQVTGTARERFGYVTLNGERDDAAKVGYFVIKNGDTYDGASGAYFNDTYSSALLIEEAPLNVGICHTITGDATDQVCYDLRGRRTMPDAKGVYIINGQKTIVK